MLHITIFLWFVDENEFLCSWFEEVLLYNLLVQNNIKPQVLADKIYTSNEFKKVKENFQVSAQYY